ncbi:hypothetical protein LJC74_05610 [Eubacteriales bacterium OttesenSCG-928-A19]|nr:hypothetical protein [Eubacteriales bacterium OttesenSCG-928-A19]
MKNRTQVFNDGTCAIYSVTNGAPPGAKPVPVLAVKHSLLRYAERIVGVSRFWGARQSNVQIDKLIRVARLEDVSTQDVAVLEDGRQYDILQAQAVQDVEPPCMDLSLQRRTERYDIG